MHVVIAAGGMPFGPRTPELASLGGSETAALMLAKALQAGGISSRYVLQSAAPARAGRLPAGTASRDGVMLPRSPREFGDYVAKTEHDLTIGVRDPQFMGMLKSKSKKKVLWAHDIFTKRGMARALDVMGWTFDEIWAVSEWHRKQIHEATGYPLENIVALRNGIVRYDDIDHALPRQEEHHLCVAPGARPRQSDYAGRRDGQSARLYAHRRDVRALPGTHARLL
jgi:hypothetical protein